jgi:hypothetical protein
MPDPNYPDPGRKGDDRVRHEKTSWRIFNVMYITFQYHQIRIGDQNENCSNYR